MSVNPHTGSVPLDIHGKTYRLQFTWDALARLEHEYGEQGYSLDKPDQLAGVLSIGLQEHHPEVTAEWVRKQSPPIGPTVEAVTLAMHYAYHGPEPAKKKGANPPKARRLRSFLKQLCGRAAESPISGT